MEKPEVCNTENRAGGRCVKGFDKNDATSPSSKSSPMIKNGWNICLEVIVLTCRHWFDWLDEISRRCWKNNNNTNVLSSTPLTAQYYTHSPHLTRLWDAPHTLFSLLSFFWLFFLAPLRLRRPQEMMDETKAGEEVASREAQASGVNRCVGSLLAWNGSSSRCTAAGCGPQIHPATRPALKH